MFVRSLILVPLFLAGCATVPSGARAPAAESDAVEHALFEMAEGAGSEASVDVPRSGAANGSGEVDPIGDGSPVDFRKKPLASFCRENSRVGMSEYAFDVKDDELQRQISANAIDFEDVMPWQASLYPDERVLKANHDRKFFLTGDGDGRGGFDPNDSVLTILDKISKGDLAASTKIWPKNVDAAIRAQEAKSSDRNLIDQQKDFEQASKAFVLLCAKYDFLNVYDCTKALRKVANLMKPVKDVTLFPLVKEIVADPVYARAAVTLAKIIQVRIEKTAYPKGNLYDDAVYAFRAHRLSDADAREHAFKLIALYSTNGANTPSFLEPFISEANRGLFYGLGVIGTGIPLLNWRTFSSGHPYAFPAKVRATCDNMKPYHFWMAAYLARETGRAVGDANAGRQAAYIAEFGYQMRAETAARDPNRPFTVRTFEPGNNKIRMDLAWGAAGAAFGASTLGIDGAATFDVDVSLRAMLDAADVKKPISEKEAQALWEKGKPGYDRWTAIFHPKLGLQKVRVFPKYKPTGVPPIVF